MRPSLEHVRAAFAKVAPDGGRRERRQRERRRLELEGKRGNPRKPNRQVEGQG